MDQVVQVNASFPEALQFLFRPARYKVAYGGRGATKSWGFARALLLLGVQRKLQVLCARELQTSIADSVHKLLSQQIEALGLQAHYTVLQHQIRGANGTEINFEGIKHNIQKIKSYEGIDICWVEEAVLVSKSSWDVLIPTIRKAGSEIWISFNPELDSDETYKRFVLNVTDEDRNQIDPNYRYEVHKLSWRDNPWFPDVLKAEMDKLKRDDYEAYLNVWEGFCKRTVEGAVYARELARAEGENRITRVPYDPIKPVDWFWDLGRSDLCCGWGAQIVGFDVRVVDYIENSQHEWAWYLKEMNRRPYLVGTVWLPHDARAKTIGTRRSVEEQTRDAKFKCRIVPRLSIEDGINATRTAFPTMFFDQAKCADGIQGLRHYRYEVEEGQRKPKPLHDWASHPADALRYLAVALKEPKPKLDIIAQARAKLALRAPQVLNYQSWMR